MNRLRSSLWQRALDFEVQRFRVSGWVFEDRGEAGVSRSLFRSLSFSPSLSFFLSVSLFLSLSLQVLHDNVRVRISISITTCDKAYSNC